MPYKNKEEKNRRARKYRDKNKEKCNQAVRDWRKKNKDYHKDYYEEHREKVNAYQREYYRKHHPDYREYNKKVKPTIISAKKRGERGKNKKPTRYQKDVVILEKAISDAQKKEKNNYSKKAHCQTEILKAKLEICHLKHKRRKVEKEDKTLASNFSEEIKKWRSLITHYKKEIKLIDNPPKEPKERAGLGKVKEEKKSVIPMKIRLQLAQLIEKDRNGAYMSKIRRF